MPQPYSTLQNIYTKVRRLTRSPSTAQLSDDDINNYVNDFLLFDLPEHLRLFDLRKEFIFYTQPYVDTYSTITNNVDSPFYQFKNRYITIHEPLYIAGFRRFYSQSREQFFGLYPQIQSIQALPQLGDGVTTNFAGRLTNAPLIRNQVQFTSLDVNSLGIVLADIPVEPVPPAYLFYPEFGEMQVPDVPPVGIGLHNYINYVTGDYDITFPVPPAAGVQINTQTVPSVVAMPQAVLYYDDVFTVRPVPDQVYKVSFEVYRRPTELLSTTTTQTPEIHQWHSLISYGAARKCFQDRMDMESLQMIEPEYRTQMNLVNRKTIVQLTNQRTSTIFTEGNANWPYGGWGNFNGGGY